MIIKNKIVMGGLLLYILTVSIACNQKKEEPTAAVPVVDTEQIKTEIQAIEDDFAAVYNTHIISVYLVKKNAPQSLRL
jgi:hypothetical protein